MFEKIKMNTSSKPVGALATLNKDGTPWNTTLHFAFDDEYIYWLSPQDTVHSRNIERDDRVSIVVWSPDELPNVKGVYIQSHAELLEGHSEAIARQAYARRFSGNIPEKFLASSTYRAKLGDINTTKSRGRLLYVQA